MPSGLREVTSKVRSILPGAQLLVHIVGPAGSEGVDMRVLLIGAPGAGKGTQAVRVADRFGIAHISSGDLLRKHVADGTATGRAVQEYVRRGDLVPDGVVMDILYKPVSAASKAGGYVLDGFPRTVEQAKAAYMVARDLGANVQVAVHLDVPRHELVRRLLARGRGADDTADVIDHRLQVYEESTVPMLDYYAEREQLVTVDGAQPAEDVSSSLLQRLARVQQELPS
jgi:adenylate kinase